MYFYGVQALNPFYMFQLFSCALWFGDEYYYYASCIIVVSCLSLAVQIYQTRSVCQSISRFLYYYYQGSHASWKVLDLFY